MACALRARNYLRHRRTLPAGIELVQLFTVTWGLPPANADVVLIRRVRAPICDEVKVLLIVVGLLTSGPAMNWKRVEMHGGRQIHTDELCHREA